MQREVDVRRTLTLGMAVLCIGAALGLPSVSAKRVTYVAAPDCRHLRIEPSKILFACADGGYYADHLHWSSWEVKRAVGRGVFHVNDCDPSCAGGTFHKRKGKIVLTKRTHCHEENKYSFDKATITYDKPYNGERRETVTRIACPL
jgi:hypothetical protein